jgi:hypothetical protein
LIGMTGLAPAEICVVGFTAHGVGKGESSSTESHGRLAARRYFVALAMK